MIARFTIFLFAGWAMQLVASPILEAGIAAIPSQGEPRATGAALIAILIAFYLIGRIAQRAIQATKGDI